MNESRSDAYRKVWSKSSDSISSVVRALIDGASTAEAMKMVRMVNGRPRKSLTAVKTAIGDVKRVFMQTGIRHPQYHATLRAFETKVRKRADAGCARKMEEFVAAPLPVQYRLFRKYGRGRSRNRKWSSSNCWFGVPDIDEAFRNIKLLPDNVEGMKLSTDEYDTIVTQQSARLEKKNEKLTVVNHAGEFLNACRDIIRNARREQKARLEVALLCVSGRRLTELLLPTSRFDPTDHKYACIFSGQLKKKEAEPPYCIPLLVDYASFRAALAAHRAKQVADIGTKSKKQVSGGGWGIKKCLGHHFGDYLNSHASAHTLRAVYIRMVYEAFDCGEFALPRVVQKALGHVTLKESLHYMSTRLDDFEGHERTLGKFPCVLKVNDT